MARQGRCSSEVRERAVRMVCGHERAPLLTSHAHQSNQRAHMIRHGRGTLLSERLGISKAASLFCRQDDISTHEIAEKNNRRVTPSDGCAIQACPDLKGALNPSSWNTRTWRETPFAITSGSGIASTRCSTREYVASERSMSQPTTFVCCSMRDAKLTDRPITVYSIRLSLPM